ncbi:ABC transporter ATP-binding protein [Staphylococcus xylosus]|uniref:ATP-binding cassette domain-containing protein n=2 Tax=Staphylococcus TaxID=1279 RepID=A0A1W7M5B0_STAXY|nr:MULTISPECIES: ATP-binding cassette domain-containing protein [Staphylococcus]PTE23915.1 bacitracin ABC transporter ATP-binding protein [Staphylococcus equorum]PTH95128.1 bacitracin ABC transporter ATP-binding protein [Staphylococcus shinii]RIM90758.1 ATP-binding cassette domain-containing protein [Staphylococcus xylosus]CZT31767.1 putative ATP-binding cassette ABC transporter [Staphylococcus xylosus]
MQEVILKTSNLTKQYHNYLAAKDVDITINKGDIYGLIGENGAGKSTLLRMITGLSIPTKGSLELFGESNWKMLDEQRKRIGGVIEKPALFSNMTAYENLEVHRLQRGIPGKACVREKLEIVGLTNTEKKKVADFSLGMKQRLGLAIALLSDPALLILDEPTNGLDPMGIIELRELILKLNYEQGLTVLVSSHILSELYELANKFGIIHQGELLEELSSDMLEKKCKQYIQIKVDNVYKGASVLEKNLNTHDFEILSDGTLRIYKHLDDIYTISKTLTDNHLVIEHLSKNGENLESYFTNLIKGAAND